MVTDVSHMADKVNEVKRRLAEMVELNLWDSDGFVPAVRGGP